MNLAEGRRYGAFQALASVGHLRAAVGRLWPGDASYQRSHDFRLVRPRVKGFTLADSMTAQMYLSWAEKRWLAQ